MKKYIHPEIKRIIVKDDVITASGGDGYAEDIFESVPDF